MASTSSEIVPSAHCKHHREVAYCTCLSRDLHRATADAHSTQGRHRPVIYSGAHSHPCTLAAQWHIRWAVARGVYTFFLQKSHWNRLFSCSIGSYDHGKVLFTLIGPNLQLRRNIYPDRPGRHRSGRQWAS